MELKKNQTDLGEGGGSIDLVGTYGQVNQYNLNSFIEKYQGCCCQRFPV